MTATTAITTNNGRVTVGRLALSHEVPDGGRWAVGHDTFTAPYSAPTPRPPPWHLYPFTFRHGLSTTEPGRATRCRSGQ